MEKNKTFSDMEGKEEKMSEDRETVKWRIN